MINILIRENIYTAVKEYSDLTDNEKIIVSCLIYEYVNKILKSESIQNTTVNNLISSYIASFANIVSSMKYTNTSYNDILTKISNINKSNFLEYTLEDISNIYLLYSNGKSKEYFSIHRFSTEMYGISGSNINESASIKNIHYSIMCPIVKYYIKYYNADEKKVFISYCNRGRRAGHDLYFTIDPIPNSKIISDLKKNIKLDIYRYEIKKHMIHLIIN